MLIVATLLVLDHGLFATNEQIVVRTLVVQTAEQELRIRTVDVCFQMLQGFDPSSCILLVKVAPVKQILLELGSMGSLLPRIVASIAELRLLIDLHTLVVVGCWDRLLSSLSHIRELFSIHAIRVDITMFIDDGHTFLTRRPGLLL